MNRPFPIQASRTATAAETLTRAAFAHAMQAHVRYPISIEKVFASLWPKDDVSPIVAKAAVTPADSATAAFAGVLAQEAVGDYVETLGSLSAFSQVSARAVRASLAGINSLTFPRRATPPAAGDVTWVSEGEPIPVKKFNLTGGATLGPGKKLASIIVATRELMEHSTAEQVFSLLMRESIAFDLDATVFSNAAATASAPAGILNGIAALTATAGGGDTAQQGDLEKLAAGIADNSDNVVLVTHPRQALSLRIRRPDLDIPVFSTRAISAGTVIALDPQALAIGYGNDPRFESSKETVLHMVDAAPAQIGTVGTPTVTAAPALSMYQSDCIATRAILPVAYAIRQPGAIAWISGATWG